MNRGQNFPKKSAGTQKYELFYFCFFSSFQKVKGPINVYCHQFVRSFNRSREMGQMYYRFGEAIRSGTSCEPNFDTAVGLHQFIDNIRESTDQGRRVVVAQG